MGLKRTVYLEEEEKCVFRRRRKMMGFGQTVDLKIQEIIQGKGRKIMGFERTVYLEEEEK